MKINEIEYSNRRFYRVWQADNASSSLIEELDNTLSKGITSVYYQTPWMGRGCFKPYNGSFIFLKGIGETKGSEEFRKIMELFWRKRSAIDRGGCVRLEMTDFPILIEYFYTSENEIELFDPRPEGYSIFGAVLREAIISDFLENCGLLIPKAIAVYKTVLKQDWKDNDQRAMGEYCLNKFREKMKIPDTVKINLSKVQYQDPTSGVLVRLLKSSVRLQEVVEVYLNNEDKLPSFNEALDKEASDKGFDSWTDMLENGMIINLIGMLRHGIIHSNLQTHYQNFSLMGEICDWDAAIIHADFKDASNFKEKLRALENEHSADMMEYYEMDEEMHKDYDTFAIQQIYAILNSCLFARKIRKCALGCTYGKMEMRDDENQLIDKMLKMCTDTDKSLLRALCEKADDCSYSFRIVGRASIYGWNCYERDKDYSKHICTEENKMSIIEDVKRTLKLIGECI